MKKNNYMILPSLSAFKKMAFMSLACAGLLLQNLSVQAQSKKIKVLFIGNSFTDVNDLPLLFKQSTYSAGDSVDVLGVAPGGYTLEMHSKDAATLTNIASGGWNYVVLQEQSQRPAFPDADVATDVYPYARSLDSFIHDKNTCGRTVFYQTWGYRDGDVSNCPTFPPVCTYEGMDSMLALRYNQMAIDNNALLAPVGKVFKELKAIKPTINLYQPDGMHPSEIGSFAAAVTFYTIIFRKDPRAITFNFTLTPPDADLVRQTVFFQVYNFLSKYYVGMFDPVAGFSSTIAGSKVDFNSAPSLNASNFNWSFGDGGTSTLANPSHTYASPGTYSVRLIVDDCIRKDTTTQSITALTSGIDEHARLNQIEIYPNPAQSILHIQSSGSMANIGLRVMNLLGADMNLKAASQASSIDIQHLSAGVYWLQLLDTQTGATQVKKFIKE